MLACHRKASHASCTGYDLPQAMTTPDSAASTSGYWVKNRSSGRTLVNSRRGHCFRVIRPDSRQCSLGATMEPPWLFVAIVQKRLRAGGRILRLRTAERPTSILATGA